MNENEANRIAHAVNALRPDWPVSSVRTLITERMANRTRRDVAVALTWVACDSATKTPARALEAGPWWNATNAEGSSGERPHWLDLCSVCSYTERAHSSPALSDHAFLSNGDKHSHRPAEPQVDPARAALAETRATLCGHGIPHNVCKETHE